MDFLKPNEKYNASLTADYTVGDSTLHVSSIPVNFPTIVTVARGTSKETRFTVTGASPGVLTGVSRRDGASENISAGVSVECMIDADFITQLQSAVFTQVQLKGLIYAADGGSSDTYAITLPVPPTSYDDILGLPIAFKANTANTGSCTLNVNGLGDKAIKKEGTVDLNDGDISANQIVPVVWDGTNFQMLVTPAQQIQTDGWTPTTDTFVYVSANSFKIVGVDRTAIFTKGTRVKFTNNSTTYYGTVISSSFSADTTVTLAANDDFAIANSAITNPFYSYAANPQGYPTWYKYTPTYTGFSVDPSSGYVIFKITGNSITIKFTKVANGGTSNANTFTATAPVAAIGSDQNWMGFFHWLDNGGDASAMGEWYINGGSNILRMRKTVGNDNSWTTSGAKFGAGELTYPF